MLLTGDLAATSVPPDPTTRQVWTSSQLMFFHLSESPNEELAEEMPAQYGKEVSYVHGHNSQHASKPVSV